MKNRDNRFTYLLAAALILAVILGAVVGAGNWVEQTFNLPYATREEALRHCPNPMEVAGPVREPSRGWRCPARE